MEPRWVPEDGLQHMVPDGDFAPTFLLHLSAAIRMCLAQFRRMRPGAESMYPDAEIHAPTYSFACGQRGEGAEALYWEGRPPSPSPYPLRRGRLLCSILLLTVRMKKKTKEKTWAHFKSLKNLKISSPFYFSPLMFLVLHVTSYNEEENMLINMKILTFEGPC